MRNGFPGTVCRSAAGACDVAETEAPETGTSHHTYDMIKPFLQRNGLIFHVTGYAETGSGSN